MAGKRSQRSSTLKVLAWKLIVGLGSVYVNYVQARPKTQTELNFESNDKILLILRPFYQSSSHCFEKIRINAIAPPCRSLEGQSWFSGHRITALRPLLEYHPSSH
jgi:hypothetical protein